MKKKVLVFGGTGLVGTRFIDLNKENFEISAPTTEQVNILNKQQVKQVIETAKSDCVINFAAITQVESAEQEKDNKDGIYFKVNAIGAKNIADICKDLDKHLVQISTEYVFDGTKEDSPYTEEDRPNPINWYGETKMYGEEYVLESGCKSTIVRISMPYVSFYPLKKDVARFFLEQLRQDKQIRAVEDQRITPTLVDEISNALKVLIAVDSPGIYHVSATDSVTPLEFAKTIAETFNFNYSLIDSISFDKYNENKKGKLLKYSWLNPTKFEKEFGNDILHTVEEGLIIFKQEIDQHQ